MTNEIVKKESIIKSFGNRLGILRKVISYGGDRPISFYEDHMRRIYKTKNPDEKFMNEVCESDIKLLKFYFSECKDGNGGYDMKKFEAKAERMIVLGEDEYPHEAII